MQIYIRLFGYSVFLIFYVPVYRSLFFYFIKKCVSVREPYAIDIEYILLAL